MKNCLLDMIECKYFVNGYCIGNGECGSLETTFDKMKQLLTIAKCPCCDGSGAIPVPVGDDDWEAEQCRWCDERNSIIKE